MDLFAQFLNDEETTNIVFNIDGQKIRAHADILKMRSEYYKNMLNNECKESVTGQIEVKDTTFDAFHAYLHYVYANDIDDVSGDTLIGLYELANLYCDEVLKEACEEAMANQITSENCLRLYSVALQYERKNLEKVCLEFIAPRLKSEVVRTADYASFDADLFKDLFTKLVDMEYGEPRNDVKQNW